MFQRLLNQTCVQSVLGTNSYSTSLHWVQYIRQGKCQNTQTTLMLSFLLWQEKLKSRKREEVTQRVLRLWRERRAVKRRTFPRTQLLFITAPYRAHGLEQNSSNVVVQEAHWSVSDRTGSRVRCVRKTFGEEEEKKHLWIQRTESVKFRFSAHKYSWENNFHVQI